MKTRTRSVTTIEVDDNEVELEYTPEYYEPTISQPTPTTLVVGYLMHDEDAENPMTSCDCEGKLYTAPGNYGGGYITDDARAASYLGLAEFGGSRDDPEYDLEAGGVDDRVAEKLMTIIKGNPAMNAWMVASIMETGAPFLRVMADLVDEMQGYRNTNYDWDSELDIELLALLPDYETLAKTAWEELYNEGKIGEYLAVPVYWCGSNHGPGTASAGTTSLDDANAVWVPDACAIDNMNFKDCVTYLEKLAVADKYASGVLDQYTTWANGECYGVVVESFKLVGDRYEQVNSDACWGYIGYKWAEQALKEQIEYAESTFNEEVTA